MDEYIEVIGVLLFLIFEFFLVWATVDSIYRVLAK